jgi:hypothetical protein
LDGVVYSIYLAQCQIFGLSGPPPHVSKHTQKKKCNREFVLNNASKKMTFFSDKDNSERILPPGNPCTVHTLVYLYAFMCVCICVCVCVYTCIHVYVYMCICVCVYFNIWVNICIRYHTKTGGWKIGKDV